MLEVGKMLQGGDVGGELWGDAGEEVVLRRN